MILGIVFFAASLNIQLKEEIGLAIKQFKRENDLSFVDNI
jgi:hypothetical protein